MSHKNEKTKELHLIVLTSSIDVKDRFKDDNSVDVYLLSELSDSLFLKDSRSVVYLDNVTLSTTDINTFVNKTKKYGQCDEDLLFSGNARLNSYHTDVFSAEMVLLSQKAVDVVINNCIVSSSCADLIYFCTKEMLKFKIIKSNYKTKSIGFLASLSQRLKLTFNYFFSQPIIYYSKLSDKTACLKDFANSSSKPISRFVFALVVLAMFIVLPIMSTQSGISGDEHTLYKQAAKSYNYFKTFGEDKSAILNNGRDPMYLYGQSFDLITYTLVKAFGIDDVYTFRHICNSLLGVLIIFLAGLLLVFLKGWRSGVVVMLLLLLSPRLLAHSFNNPKDLPFALGFIATFYYSFRINESIYRPRLKHLVALVLAIAFTISIRIGGLLLFPYVVLLFGLGWISKTWRVGLFNKKSLRLLGVYALYAVVIIVVSYFLGILLWPYGIDSPLVNPLIAMESMTNFSISIRQLFEGVNVFSNKLPWYYASKYIIITTPLVVLFGFALFLVGTIVSFKKNNIYILFLLFTLFFPLVYIYIKESNLYGGMRHVLFVYPSLVILAALGISCFYNYFSKKLFRYIFISIVVVLSILPFQWMVRSYPHYLSYYNETIGGMKGAYGNYELDYWYGSLKQASEWFDENVKPEKKIIITTQHSAIVSDYLKHNKNFEISYSRYYSKSQNDWDYAILHNSFISSYQLKNRIYPIKGTIKEFKVDGKPICIIVKRPSKDDYLGYQAMRKNQPQKAINHFSKYLSVDPNNAEVLNYVAQIYLSQDMLAHSEKYCRKSLSKYPDFSSALVTLGRIQMINKEYKKSISTFATVLQKKETYWGGYYYLALNFYYLKDYKSAKRYSEYLTKVKVNMAEPYQLLSIIYQKEGNEKASKLYLDKYIKLKQ